MGKSTEHKGRNPGGNLADLAEKASDSILGPNPFIGLNKKDALDAFKTVLDHTVKNPASVLKHQSEFMKDLAKVAAGKSEREPNKGDRRFKDKAWSTNPFYHAYMQAYLSWVDQLNNLVDDLGMDKQDAERSRFLVNLVTDSLSATNTLIGNPEAIRKLVDTGGQSAVQGIKNMIHDMKENNFMPSQVDKSKFAVGENLATSEGSVIFKNDVLELIQYRPLTEKVATVPVLIVPPQINKFYVFDLSPEKSLVQHLLKSGLQVFMVSWRNPTAEQRDWDMETYVGAIGEATDAIVQISGSKKVNVFGACAGGVTTTIAAAYLAAQHDERLNSLTLLVTVLDMSTTSDTALGLFANEQTIALAKARSQSAGVLEGAEMAKVFAWLRPNDLVWSYWVNNYLLGNEPPAFDILYWNNDTTRLPAGFHSQLLDMFINNPLVDDQQSLEIHGTSIDANNITADVYLLGGTTDHITPWKATYQSCSLFGGKVTYVLSNSGHVQSIINPPGNPKASYFVSDNPSEDTEAFLLNASRHEDSWWNHWVEWLKERSGKQKAAPGQLGNDDLKELDKAPGSYVLDA